MPFLQQTFLTRHRELRSGWKILLFVMITAAGAIGVSVTVGRLLHGVPGADEFLALAVAFAASWAMTRWINRKPLSAIGLWVHPRAMQELGIGLLLGFLMMTGIVIVQLASGYLTVTWRAMPWGEAAGTATLACVFFALAAMTEELLFRGYPFQTLIQGITALPAIIVMSGIFGIAHAMNPHADTSQHRQRDPRRDLAVARLSENPKFVASLGLHFAWNFTQTTVYGFPTSGLQFVDRTLWVVGQTGPDWITGGSFGPEGGVLATLALLAGTWYVMKSRALSVPEGIITLDSVEDLSRTRGRKRNHTHEDLVHPCRCACRAPHCCGPGAGRLSV